MHAKFLSTAATVSMMSGLVLAQNTDCRTHKDNAIEYGKTASVVQPEDPVKIHTVMIRRINDREYKVEIENGTIKAWIDGKRVPKKRLDITEETIRILDKDGETLVEFARGIPTRTRQFGKGKERGMFSWPKQHDDDPISWETEEDHARDNAWTLMEDSDIEPPPVMLGIMIANVDEDLAEELGLNEGEGIVINNIFEGLPAEKAGLREGDVIVEIEGKRPVDMLMLLQEFLAEKEPGDVLEVVILREGKEQTIEIELEAYDAETLGMLMYDLEMDENPLLLWDEEDLEAPEEMLDALRERLEMLQQESEAFNEDMEILNEDMGRLMDILPRIQPRELDVFPRLRTWRGDTEEDQRLLVQPSPRDYDDRFDRIKERLKEYEEHLKKRERRLKEQEEWFKEREERLEDRLERLEDRINRLLKALEDREHDET